MMKTKNVKGKNKPELRFKSKRQFFWRFSVLKKSGGEITVTDRTPEMDVKEYNRIELLVNDRVRWELGLEGFNIWEMNGAKDIPTLAKAYGIK
jgi:hypothetical protein